MAAGGPPAFFSISRTSISQQMKKTIFFGGQERPVNYGTLFLFNYQEKYNQSPLGKINEILAKLPTIQANQDDNIDASILTMLDFPYMVNLLIVALESGQEERGEVVEKFTKAQVCEWVDEAGGMQFLLEVLMGVFAALPQGKPEQNRSAGVPAKKKNQRPS
jgi:hypothetical protein